MIKTIFLDMDGVLVDHHAGLQRTFPGWDMTQPIHEYLQMDENRFWLSMENEGEEWWRDLPPLPWAHQLVDACEEAAGWANVYILTAPSRTCTSTATGKLRWLRDNLPQFNTGGRVMIGNHKWLLAAPDRLLIDDTPKKYQDWVAAGGQGWLFTPKTVDRLLQYLAGDRSSED